MRAKRLLLTIALVALSAGAWPAQTISEKAFRVEKLGDGGYAFLRSDPPSLWFTPNNGLIVGKRYAIVIDSNISSSHTREILAAVRRITSKPVRYVVNTHWHEDHIIGDHVYKEAFPDVKFVGHRSMVNDLATTGANNRKGSLEHGGGFIKSLRASITSGKSLAGTAMTDEERLGYASDITLVEAYLAEAGTVPIVMPDVLVDDKLELDRDNGVQVQVLFLGKAHTGADLAVYVPDKRIAFSGDLTAWPVPLVGSTAYPLDYAATLEKLAALKADVFVPGHGPVMRDGTYIRLMIDLLNSIKEQVTAAVAAGKSLDETRKSVDLERFKQRFCGESAHKRFIFDNYVFASATAAAYNQLKAGK
jgi:cyclase